jgi:7-cyano-7-deazaguanine reductase
MEKRGGIDSKLKAMKFIEETASADLSELLETNVEVTCFHTYEYESMDHNNKYLILEEIVDFNFPSKILYYSETPSLLKIEKEANKAVVQRYRSSLLKSNCKVTSQPDWGDVFIHCKSNKIIDKESLLSYIVSFRDECHFHEEICEAIYKRLLDTYQPEELLVYCYYVRRGGIDINPIRASSVDLINVDVIDPAAPFLRTGRQ